MNNEIAREILSAYRPGGADAGDPRFAEPLARCQVDPELGRWFEAERSLDQQVANCLKKLAAPATARASLLATAEIARPSVIELIFRRVPATGLAAALFLGIGAAFWALNTSSVTTDSLPLLAGEYPSAQLVAWIDGLQSLDYTGNTPAEVLGWLASAGAPVPGSFPAGLDVGSVNGCKVFTRENGSTVSLICFMSRGELVHFFTWEAPEGTSGADFQPTWFARAAWNGASWREGHQVHALMGRVDREKIREIIASRTRETTA